MSPSSPPSALGAQQVFRRCSSLVCREIAGESILVPVRGQLAELQKIFVLNEVGGFIWQLLNGDQDLASIQGSLVRHFEVTPAQALQDLQEYVASLSQAGLVEEVEGLLYP